MNGADNLEFFIDHSRCIGCKACMQACEECDTHRGVSMIHLETIMRADSVQTAPQVCMHCDLRAGVPVGRDQEDTGRRCPEFLDATMHRLFELCFSLPLRRAQVQSRDQPDDEMRHVL